MIINKKNLINQKDPETEILRCRKELKNAQHRKILTTLLSYSGIKALFHLQNLLTNKIKMEILESCGLCGVCGVGFPLFSTANTAETEMIFDFDEHRKERGGELFWYLDIVIMM